MGIHEQIPRPRVTFPSITKDTGAMSVRGHQMGAIRDGWYVLFEDHQSRPHDGIVDELCVVQIRGGNSLLRFVKKGRKLGTWDLVPISGEPIIDADLEWAERVEWIRPHRLTDAELVFLETLDSRGEYVGR